MDHNIFLKEVKVRLKEVFQDRFQGAILYGSEVRGEAGEDSDIDLLVLLEGPIVLHCDLLTIIRALYPLQLELVRQIDVTPVDINDFEAGEYALYRNARNEGLRV